MLLNKKKQNRILIAFVLPALLFLTAFKLVPAALGIWYSLTNWNGISKTYDFVGLRNFIELFTEDTNFWKSMWFTLKYVIVAVIAMNLVAVALAVMVEALRRGKGLFRTIFYMPNMISLIIGGYMWQFIFTQVLYYLADNTPLTFLGVSWIGDTRFAFLAILIVAVWGGAGYLMVIYIAGLQNVPANLTEAALVDGAGTWQRLLHVTFPMMKQSFTICLFVTLNNAFQVFDVVYSLTGGGPGRATQVAAINIYEEAFGRSKRFGYATAKSTVLSFVILAITLLQLYVMKRREEEL